MKHLTERGEKVGAQWSVLRSGLRLAGLAALLSVFAAGGVAADPSAPESIFTFKGTCLDSKIKWGLIEEDLTAAPGDPVSCDAAIFMSLPNGRRMMQFVTGRGLLGFAGSELARDESDGSLMLSIDRIHPIRDLGNDPDEIYRRGRSGEGVLEGAEGVCIFSADDIKSSTYVACIGKHEAGNKKTVFTVRMNVASPQRGGGLKR